MPDDGGTLVVVPTLDEGSTIAELVRRLFAAAGDSSVALLVVDDGSRDGTAQIAAGLGESSKPVHVIERPRKLGLGTAYVTGFLWGLRRGYATIVEMDADLSHDPADMPRLVEALADADLVIGSRYVAGGSIPAWGPFRRALSAGGNLYARRWLRLGVRDSTSGFRAYRSSVLRELALTTVRAEGYAFQIEMTRRVRRAGGRIVEVPIRFVDRTHGRSKLSRAVVAEALVLVTLWGAVDRLRDRRSARATRADRRE
jgi:dolichol-phosphate mannosyltransferase